MEKQYDVIFFGVAESGEEKPLVIQRVASLLMLSDAQARELSESTKKIILITTPDEDRARTMTQQLIEAGASCKYRVNPASQSSWQDWELEQQKTTQPANVFTCLACEYSKELEPEQPPIETCPECGVVQAKYDAAAEKKRERERIKRHILGMEEAKAKRAEEELERQRQEALRKEIEAEIRAELELQHGKRNKFQMAGAVAATFIVGVSGPITYYSFAEPAAAPVPEPIQVAAAIPVKTHTLSLASNVVAKLGDALPPMTLPNAPAMGTNSAVSQAHAAVAGQPQHAEAVSADALLAGSASSPPVTDDVASSAELPQEMMDHWYQALPQDPIFEVHTERLVQDQVDQGYLSTANEVSRLAESPATQVKLQTQIAQAVSGSQNAPVDPKQLSDLEASINQLATLEDKASSLIAMESIKVSGPVADDVDARLEALFPAGSSGTVNRLQAEALIAGKRALQGNHHGAERWFNAANETLEQIPDPVSQLSGLPRLARQYNDANDFKTARTLLQLTATGLTALPPTTQAADIAVELADTFAAIGLVDEAAEVTQRFFRPGLQKDLRLTKLAVDTARHGRVISAEGLLSLIRNDAQRAIAKAQVSLIAYYAGHRDIARTLAEDAREDSMDLSSPVDQVVASELLRATEPQGLPETKSLRATAAAELTATEGQAVAQAKTIIATNLAWVGDIRAAKKMAASIQDYTMRRKTRERIAKIETLVRIKRPASFATSPVLHSKARKTLRIGGHLQAQSSPERLPGVGSDADTPIL